MATTPLRKFLQNNQHCITKWEKELNDTTVTQLRIKSLITSITHKRSLFEEKRKECDDDGNSDPQDYNDADDMIDKCNDLLALAESLSLSSATVSTSLPKTSKCSVSLPKIHIDSFSGDISKFDRFWNLFANCIDNNPDISDCAKFGYLLSYLRGEPADMLSGLHIDSGNYATAKALLTKRYGDKRKLLQQYVDSFLNLPVCDGSALSLRNFHTKFSYCISKFEKQWY